jgi:hypothetical protein
MLLALLAVVGLAGPAGAPALSPPQPLATFAQLADDVLVALRRTWYVPGRGWRGCTAVRCAPSDSDWGADSLTGVLYERWLLTRDVALVPWMRALLAAAPDHRHDEGMLSDVPLWDAVAALRMYDVTHDASALRRAEDDYAYVARTTSFARGACAGIDYQYPQRGAERPDGGGLKTLESDANRVLAAALLARRVADSRARRTYLADARRVYALVRNRFRDPQVGLFSVYAFDTGRTCTVVPRRFFASVNGVMIEAGLALADASGQSRYAREARATARAIAALDDDRGVFTDLQAENDIAGPLVLAMVELARRGDAFARDWIVRNAGAAAHARRADGAYARFFDGPPPRRDAIATVFQSNGGFALLVAAGSFAPRRRPEPDDPWPTARVRALDLGMRSATSFAFTGSGVALFGTLGERCAPAYRGDPMCEGGHAHLRLDGRAMVNQTGIWQGKTVIGAQPNSILFAWRWLRARRHVLQFTAGETNGKEGSSFLHVRRVVILP